jgi:hypothetical protein
MQQLLKIIMVLRVIEWGNLLHLPLFGKEGDIYKYTFKRVFNPLTYTKTH